MSSFEHVNFSINEKYSKKDYDSPNYYASLMIFQTYKNVVLRNVHSLGWLFSLCFYPLMLTIEPHEGACTLLCVPFHWEGQKVSPS